MAQGLANRPVACEDHPHRPAVDRCDRCRRPFCAACLVRGRPELLCRTCWATAPAREVRAARTRHPLYRRLDALRANRADALAAAVIAAVLALLGASAAAQVVAPGYSARVGEAVRAVRGGVPAAGPPEPSASPTPSWGHIPNLLLRFGGSPAAIAELVPGTDPGALVDGRVVPDAPSWRSPPGFPAPELRLRARNDAPAAQLLFALSATAPPETWAKEVEVWLTLTPDGSDAVRVGRWTLAPTTEPQAFAFPPARVVWVRVRVLSNQGNADSTSLAEIALLSAGAAVAPGQR